MCGTGQGKKVQMKTYQKGSNDDVLGGASLQINHKGLRDKPAEKHISHPADAGDTQRDTSRASSAGAGAVDIPMSEAALGPSATSSMILSDGVAVEAYRKPDVSTYQLSAAGSFTHHKNISAPSHGIVQQQSTVLAEPSGGQRKRGGASGGSKYVNLYSDEGKGKMSALVPGRVLCGCNTTKHALVNNCLACGMVAMRFGDELCVKGHYYIVDFQSTMFLFALIVTHMSERHYLRYS